MPDKLTRTMEFVKCGQGERAFYSHVAFPTVDEDCSAIVGSKLWELLGRPAALRVTFEAVPDEGR